MEHVKIQFIYKISWTYNAQTQFKIASNMIKQDIYKQQKWSKKVFWTAIDKS